MTVLTGAHGRQVDLVWYMWKEDLLWSREFEVPGIPMPNFELFFSFFLLLYLMRT